MAEYIEREALLKAARKNRSIGLCEADIVDVQDLINGQPAADVVEVVHGEWVNRTKKINGLVDYRYDCSVCGEIFWAAGIDGFNYCPNCGAKMDGEPHA